jgi:hypothetical protein
MQTLAENLAHSLAMSEFDRVDTVYHKLEPIGDGYGRVIVYWEKRPMISGTGSFRLEGNAGFLETGFAAQTGTIIDLPSGQYSISSSGWDANQDIYFDVAEGESSCFDTETVYSVILGARSGSINAAPIEECLTRISKKDIHCNMNSCTVITVVPANESHFEPYATSLSQEQLDLKTKEEYVEDDKSRIYILRRRYTLGQFKSGLDARPTITMESSSYVCYEVNPGFHILTVLYPFGELGFKLKSEGGKSYYFSTDSLTFVDTNTGKELVAEYELLENGFYKNKP